MRLELKISSSLVERDNYFSNKKIPWKDTQLEALEGSILIKDWFIWLYKQKKKKWLYHHCQQQLNRTVNSLKLIYWVPQRKSGCRVWWFDDCGWWQWWWVGFFCCLGWVFCFLGGFFRGFFILFCGLQFFSYNWINNYLTNWANLLFCLQKDIT